MPTLEIEDWAITNAGNGLGATPENAPENMNRTDVNNCIREVMAVLARYYQDPEFLDLATSKDATAVTFVDATTLWVVKSNESLVADYAVGRRCWCDDGAGARQYGVISSVSYSDPNTIVGINFDAAASAVPADVELGEFQVHAMATLTAEAFGLGSDVLEARVFG